MPALIPIRFGSSPEATPKRPLVAGRSGGSGACILPSLDDMILWADASVFASLGLSGSTINTVTDQSGAGNNLSVLGSAALPMYDATGLNGKPAMVFSLAGAENSALANSSFTMGTGNELTFWCAGAITGFDGNGRMLSYTGPGEASDWGNVHSWAADIGSLSQTLRIERHNQITPVSNDTIGDSLTRWIGTINSSGEMIVYVNGVAYGPPTSAPGNWTSGGVFVFGRSQLDPIGVAGNYGEFGICAAWHDPTTVGLLDDYLLCKWS